MKSVEIAPGPSLQVSAPKLLFKLKDAGAGSTKFISPDGQQFVFAIRQPAR